MVDRTPDVMNDTHRRMTFGYRLSLGLLMLAVMMMAAVTGYMVNKQTDDTTLVNIAGRQRMYCQRIALLSHELLEHPGGDRHQYIKMLNQSVTQMAQEHDILLEDARQNAVTGGKSKILALYTEPPLDLNAQINEYLDHARAILSSSSDTHDNDAHMQAIILAAHDRLFSSLDAAVQSYETLTIERFQHLYHIIVFLALVALVTLMLVAVAVLRPALAYIAQAQQRLIELNQLKGDFLANISHEIRTPMNGIFGMTELLLDSNLNPRQQHYTRTLQNSADHLLGLINDVLDFSKLEAGQMKLDPIHFNLLSTIEDVLELLAAQARERNLELLLHFKPGTPRFVVADPGRIRQVLFNLIGNAIKFTDQGYVMVHAEMIDPLHAPNRSPWLRVRIEDTGTGIPEDKISSLFEKFMQVESGSNRARQGTGLGLAISRNLVRLMGGDIRVESQVGKGTTFTWEIPLAEATRPQPVIDTASQLTGKRALLVDDLAPNRMLYKEALISGGLECLVAENAQEALSILAYELDSNRKIDLVLTDYMMPITDGAQLTRRIKDDPRFRHIPVIILSSVGDQNVIKKMDTAGASACLAKPTTRQSLLETMTVVMGSKSKGEMRNILGGENGDWNTQHKAIASSTLQGAKILMAEDNRVNIEITSELLAQFGCQVTIAENGEEAIKAARSQVFDLILMDCQMPIMDGFEAARQISAMKANKQIAPVPIVALTANALKGDRERCLESGMDDYLAKPMRKANLEAILLKWLKRSPHSTPIATLTAAAATTSAVTPALIKTAQPTRDSAEITYLHHPSRGPVPAEQADEAPLQAEATYPPKPMLDSAAFDVGAFDAARDMLGSKFPKVVSYYLEDAEGYLDRIAQALQQEDANGAIVPAHTLKSSSRQLGAILLADLASKMETAARQNANNDKIEDIRSLLPAMRDALASIKPYFESGGVA